MAFLIYFAFISQHIDTAKFTKGLFEPESDFWAPSRAPGRFCGGLSPRRGLAEIPLHSLYFTAKAQNSKVRHRIL